MLILKGTSWDDSQNFIGATGKAAEVLGVYERTGMPNAVIVRIKGVRADFPVGVQAYLKTKTYDAAGKVFYHYDKGIKDKGQVNVYIRTPYKGTDPGGGLLSREPIIAEQARSQVESEMATPGTLPAQEKTEAAIAKASTGLPKRTMIIGAIVLIAVILIAKKLKK
jgi:hypothetical protein